jgi:iron(III) transport system ATP-binding protein
LLDEPFAALDAALRARVRHEVVSILRGAASTVVFVTHDQQEALSLADQVAVLRDGHIAQVGSPGDLYARPIDPALAAFLGEANLVDATVVDGIADTPLGPLRADEGGKGPVVAMVRPEQITITPDHSPTGLRGHVLAVEFQGHDSMITVASDVADHTAHVRVRVQGTAHTAPGDAVTLTANGTVSTWPRTLDPTQPSSSESLSPRIR